MSRKRLILITAVLIVGIGVVAIAVIRNLPSPRRAVNIYELQQHNRIPCVVFYEDNGADGSSPGRTESAFFMDLPGAEVQVDDPNGSDTGHFAPETCFLRGTNDNRKVTVTVTLPSAYRTRGNLQFQVSLPPGYGFIEMGIQSIPQVGIIQ